MSWHPCGTAGQDPGSRAALWVCHSLYASALGFPKFPPLVIVLGGPRGTCAEPDGRVGVSPSEPLSRPEQIWRFSRSSCVAHLKFSCSSSRAAGLPFPDALCPASLLTCGSPSSSLCHPVCFSACLVFLWPGHTMETQGLLQGDLRGPGEEGGRVPANRQSVSDLQMCVARQ